MYIKRRTKLHFSQIVEEEEGDCDFTEKLYPNNYTIFL
jgi:hypothetical protein